MKGKGINHHFVPRHAWRGLPFCAGGFLPLAALSARDQTPSLIDGLTILRTRILVPNDRVAKVGATTPSALQPTSGNIQHTVRYTELSPTRLKDFWSE